LLGSMLAKALLLPVVHQVSHHAAHHHPLACCHLLGPTDSGSALLGSVE
jgi:hypothetical protein